MKTVALGSVARIERDAVDPARIESGVLYVGLENISRDGRLVDVGPTTRGELKSNKFRFDRGHVLYGKLRPNLSKVCSPDIDGICSTDIVPIRPGKGLDQRYLTYYLRTPEMVAQATRLAVGINLPRLSPSALEAFEIPLPPIEEQRRIAAVLGAADALRAKRRQALAKLDTLTQAIFIDMFGDPGGLPRWPVVSIGDVLESATYGTSKKAGSEGEFAVLRMGNLTTDGRIDMTDLKYVDLDGREREQHLVAPGDLLFNRTNSAELVGKTAVYRGTDPVAYAGYLVRLRPGKRVNAEYLGAFMNMPATKTTLRSMCKSIIGMANINAKEVQTIRLPLPPIDLQSRFAEAVRTCEAHRHELEGSLARLDIFFASLQQRAFRGDL